jgi:NAD(P)H-hydrate epimerase
MSRLLFPPLKEDSKFFGLRQAQALLPSRSPAENKSHGGRTLVAAGSRGMFGAGVLSATAAARMGSGYVTLLTDAKAFPSARHPDFLLADARSARLPAFTAAAVGPGLGRGPQALRLVKKFLASGVGRVVIDADALNVAAEKKLFPFPPTWIATPHEGELARLLGTDARRIRADREGSARRAHEKLGCVVLLKGAGTLVASERGLRLVKSGNAALAKAGTGDVLTGILAGLLAQGLAPEDAACLGAFVHGYLADRWVAGRRDPLSLLASDLLDGIPEGLASIRRRRRASRIPSGHNPAPRGTP